MDLILITENPGKHVTNDCIIQAIHEIRNAVQENVIIATGKMHALGTKEGVSDILSLEDIEAFSNVGADVILLSAPEQQYLELLWIGLLKE